MMGEFSKIYFLVLVALLSNRVNSKHFEKEVYLRTIKTNENAFRFLNPDFDRYLSIFDHILKDSTRNISSECETSLRTLRQSLIDKEEWALKMYESNGRPSNGFISGFHHNLGNYELCLKIEPPNFENQFCLISIQGPYLENVRKEANYKLVEQSSRPITKFMIDFSYGTVLGFCVPVNCDINNLTASFNKVLGNYELQAVAQKRCSTGQFNLGPGFKAYLLVLMIPVFLCCLTLFINSDYLKPFSLKDNLNYIYNVENAGKTTENSFLHGYKNLYVSNSIVSHLYGMNYFLGMVPFVSATIKEMNVNLIVRCILERIIIGIALMFFYSGFMAFTSTYDLIKSKKTNFFKSLLFWPLSLYPGYIVFSLLALFMTSFGTGIYAADGSMQLAENFWTNGWKLFTFTSNYDHAVEQFAVYGWFNSAIFQLFVMFYFLIWLFTRSDTLGLIVSLLILCLNTIYVGYLMIRDNIPAYFNIVEGDIVSFYDFQRDYMYFYNHLDVYLIGILTGWAYKKNKTSFLKNSVAFYLLHIVALILSYSVIFVPKLFDTGILANNQILLVGYFATKRILIALYLVTIFLTFRLGRLESVKNFLSWKYFVPFSRLSSSMVSAQFLYFYYVFGTRTKQYTFTIEDLMKETVFTLLCTFTLANVFYLFYEAPLKKILSRLVLGKPRQSKTEQRKDIELNNNYITGKTSITDRTNDLPKS